MQRLFPPSGWIVKVKKKERLRARKKAGIPCTRDLLFAKQIVLEFESDWRSITGGSCGHYGRNWIEQWLSRNSNVLHGLRGLKRCNE